MAVSLYELHRPREFTIAVSASPDFSGDYVGDGTADEVEVNAAIVVVNALGGGTVVLLEGTFNLAVTITGLSLVTIRGQGYGTLLYVPNNTFINAITFTSRQYWMVKDLRIDGNYANNADQGSEDNQNGIYVDGDVVHYSLISSVWILNCRRSGVRGKNGDTLTVSDSTFVADQRYAVYHDDLEQGLTLGCVARCEYGIHSGDRGIVANCLFWGCNTYSITLGEYGTACGNHMYAAGNGIGVFVSNATGAVVVSNEIRVTNSGIYVTQGWSINVTVVGNTIYDPLTHGIILSGEANNCNISCNNIYQAGTNSDGIYVEDSWENSIKCNHIWGGARDGIRLAGNSDDNHIFGNTCTENTGYGINISVDTCTGNIIRENDLRRNTAGPYNEATAQILDTIPLYIVTHNTDSETEDGPTVDGAGEWVSFVGQLPPHIQQVTRIEIWAVTNQTDADQMLLEIEVEAGADNEPKNTHDTGVLANQQSVTTNFAAEDIIHWASTHAAILALLGGDSVKCVCRFNALSAPDIATDADFRRALVHYV